LGSAPEKPDVSAQYCRGVADAGGRAARSSTIERSPRAVDWRAGFAKTLSGQLRDQVGTVEIVFKICEAIW
jgi:hypothetical protein